MLKPYDFNNNMSCYDEFNQKFWPEGFIHDILFIETAKEVNQHGLLKKSCNISIWIDKKNGWTYIKLYENARI